MSIVQGGGKDNAPFRISQSYKAASLGTLSPVK